ncbi:MAG: hypothetical protein NC453_21050 [Muribaculum sp.]|nr:hypothetical protein [Muribaculum sp.]
MEASLSKVNGVVKMEKDFNLMCQLLRNGEYTVKIVRKTQPRTVSQNSLMWMWYKCMEESTGQPKEDFHDYYKAKFLQRQVQIGRRVVTVVGSTTDLNTLQMTNYLEKVKADAATEFGISLPLPEDRNYQTFISEYRIR